MQRTLYQALMPTDPLQNYFNTALTKTTLILNFAVICDFIRMNLRKLTINNLYHLEAIHEEKKGVFTSTAIKKEIKKIFTWKSTLKVTSLTQGETTSSSFSSYARFVRKLTYPNKHLC